MGACQLELLVKLQIACHDTSPVDRSDVAFVRCTAGLQGIKLEKSLTLGLPDYRLPLVSASLTLPPQVVYRLLYSTTYAVARIVTRFRLRSL
jgi:hypothetical protein